MNKKYKLYFEESMSKCWVAKGLLMQEVPVEVPMVDRLGVE